MDLEEFLSNNDINNPDDIDALCELSDYTRDLITNKEFEKIGELVRYILDNRSYEAFNWVVSTIKEGFDNKQSKGFSINLGRVIKDFDGFMKAIEADERACESGTQSISDRNGEVDSFFNIQIRKTNSENMYLVSAENFDVRDNDFILYKLLFTTDLKRYVERINSGKNMIDKDGNDTEIEI